MPTGRYTYDVNLIISLVIKYLNKASDNSDIIEIVVLI